MKILSSEIEPIRGKYYETSIHVEVSYEGRTSTFRIDICGSGSTPSDREIEHGWEPDYGIDHVESQEAYLLAQKIVETLTE